MVEVPIITLHVRKLPIADMGKRAKEVSSMPIPQHHQSSQINLHSLFINWLYFIIDRREIYLSLIQEALGPSTNPGASFLLLVVNAVLAPQNMKGLDNQAPFYCIVFV